MDFTILNKRKDESELAYIIRVGRMKTDGKIDATWDDVASIFNINILDGKETHTESAWRKKYKRLLSKAHDKTEPKESEYDLIKKQARITDERAAYRRLIRQDSRLLTTLELLQEQIIRANKTHKKPVKFDWLRSENKSMYVMLSDIHYGMSFKNLAGEYNSLIARSRIMKYARCIIEKAKEARTKTCYVSLMGDLISGMIHSVIRILNKESVIEQVVGVSELISEFLLELSEYFDEVVINSVSGNHSRLEYNIEDSLRSDRLDSLIPWYCKAKLQKIDNITFVDNSSDPTVAEFIIYDKLYVATHGDMDKDFNTAATRLENIVGRKPDVFLMGHLHISEAKLLNVTFLRNGSVCGSGDEYTMRKRLFGPPVQTCFVVTPEGVESIYPIRL